MMSKWQTSRTHLASSIALIYCSLPHCPYSALLCSYTVPQPALRIRLQILFETQSLDTDFSISIERLDPLLIASAPGSRRGDTTIAT